MWLLSAQFDQLFGLLVPYLRKNEAILWWVIGGKDLIATLLTMGSIVAVQVGIFNRCVCYTRWGRKWSSATRDARRCQSP